MPSPLERELETLWSETDVDIVLEAHQRLMSFASQEDLPLLVAALKSDRNNFWTRELLAEPVASIGGVQYLSVLFDALETNYSDGHDNDSLAHFLTEIATLNGGECEAELKRLLDSPEFSHRKHAEWLLEFCE